MSARAVAAHGTATDRAIDIPRLLSRVQHYGQQAATPAAVAQMLELLQSPIATALLQMPDEVLQSLPVNDLYKYSMQNMYSQYMTGEPMLQPLPKTTNP
jgi:hypothetical protein